MTPRHSPDRTSRYPRVLDTALEIGFLATLGLFALASVPLALPLAIARMSAQAIERRPSSLLCRGLQWTRWARLKASTLAETLYRPISTPDTRRSSTDMPEPLPGLSACSWVQRSLIALALSSLDRASTQLLLRSGVPSEPPSSPQLYPSTLLELAVSAHAEDAIARQLRSANLRSLLQAGANPGDDRSLHMALAQDEIGMALELIEAGANPNAIDAFGLAPIHHAALHCAEAIEPLLLAGAKPKLLTEGPTPDFARSGLGGESALHLLAQNKIWRQEREWHPIAISSAAGPKLPTRWVELLARTQTALRAIDLLCPAEDPSLIDRLNSYGASPLHTACSQGAYPFCQALLLAGADPRPSPPHGLSARASAAQRAETMYDPSMPGHARAFHAMRLRALLDQLDICSERAELCVACSNLPELDSEMSGQGSRRL
jgi:hypothetical protein